MENDPSYKKALDKSKEIHANLIRLSRANPQGQFDKVTMRQHNFEIILLLMLVEEIHSLSREIQNIYTQLKQI